MIAAMTKASAASTESNQTLSCIVAEVAEGTMVLCRGSVQRFVRGMQVLLGATSPHNRVSDVCLRFACSMAIARLPFASSGIEIVSGRLGG